MAKACHTMAPRDSLFHAVLYGDKVSTAKFSKRLACAVKHLPLRVTFTYEHDTLKAVEKGIAKDPTPVLDEEIFMKGLVPAEAIPRAFDAHLYAHQNKERVV